MQSTESGHEDAAQLTGKEPPGHPGPLFRRILMATDFSPASLPAFELAVQMAKKYGAQLLLVHACHMPCLPELAYAPAVIYEEWDREFRAGVEKKLRTLAEDARKEGVAARVLALSGLPDEAIVAAAGQERADLILIGTHGRRGAERFFLGSIATRVIATAPCPVMTVRSSG